MYLGRQMEEIVWWDGVKGRLMEEGLEDRETRPQAKQPSIGVLTSFI